VAEIARRAGVTTGAIYSRYSGKAELLLDAIDRRMGSELEFLLSGGTGEQTAAEVLATLGSHLVDDPIPGVDLFLEAIVAARHDADLAERLRHRFSDEDARLSKLVDAAKADGQFDPTISTDAVVRLAHSLGIGMTVSRALGLPMPTDTDWSAVVDRLIVAAGATQPAQEATDDLE
jgi:TetR/AcrR family transcriptional repressor of uid operon